MGKEVPTATGRWKHNLFIREASCRCAAQPRFESVCSLCDYWVGQRFVTMSRQSMKKPCICRPFANTCLLIPSMMAALACSADGPGTGNSGTAHSAPNSQDTVHSDQNGVSGNNGSAGVAPVASGGWSGNNAGAAATGEATAGTAGNAIEGNAATGTAGNAAGGDATGGMAGNAPGGNAGTATAGNGIGGVPSTDDETCGEAIETANRPGKTAVLFITDGLGTCGQGTPADVQAANWLTQGIVTHVVSVASFGWMFPDDGKPFNDSVAVAGGTQESLNPADVASLNATLSDIMQSASAAPSCEVTLEGGQLIDLDAACERGTVTLSGEPIACDQQNKTEGFWVKAPDQIELVGSACDKLQAEGQLSASFPCDVIVIE